MSKQLSLAYTVVTFMVLGLCLPSPQATTSILEAVEPPGRPLDM